MEDLGGISRSWGNREVAGFVERAVSKGLTIARTHEIPPAV